MEAGSQSFKIVLGHLESLIILGIREGLFSKSINYIIEFKVNSAVGHICSEEERN